MTNSSKPFLALQLFIPALIHFLQSRSWTPRSDQVERKGESCENCFRRYRETFLRLKHIACGSQCVLRDQMDRSNFHSIMVSPEITQASSGNQTKVAFVEKLRKIRNLD